MKRSPLVSFFFVRLVVLWVLFKLPIPLVFLLLTNLPTLSPLALDLGLV